MNLDDRKHLAARLKHLADQLPKSDPPNTRDYAFYRTGLVLLRAGLACINDGDKAWALASDCSARGYPAGGNEPSRGGSADTSTERAALSPYDREWEKKLAIIEQERSILEDNAHALEHDIYNIVHVEERTGRTSTLIECANRHCDVTLTGLGEDRPRQGRCERCYRFRLRTGRDWTEKAEEVA